jgi:hypothetical protein
LGAGGANERAADGTPAGVSTGAAAAERAAIELNKRERTTIDARDRCNFMRCLLVQGGATAGPVVRYWYVVCVVIIRW